LRKNKLKIAVTGSIGSGKSSFSVFLKEKGYPVINADLESKTLLLKDEEVRGKIIKEFGNQSYIHGEVNKDFLADQVFSDPQKVSVINSILHPKVKKTIELLNKQYFELNDIVFTEAALIYEADMEKMFDYVVLITSDLNIRKERAMLNGRISEEDFIKRNENQISDEEKKKRADFIFENNGSIGELKQKADLLITILKGLVLK